MKGSQLAKVLLVALAMLSLPILLSRAESTQVTVEFTEVPPDGAGSESRGNIAGAIAGLPTPEAYKVVLYAHTNRWYVQPLISHPFTDIASDGRWSNWTHLGHRYGALLVRPSFQPPATTQSLPPVGGDVIAKAEVAAKKR